MRKIFFLLLLAPFFVGAQTGDKNFIDQNYIEVTGTSEMNVIPDMIYLRILINEKDNKNKTSLADRESAMISKLKGIGVDVDKDLSVKDIASNFKNYWLTKSEILLSKEYQLIVKEGKTAGKVFIELESIGISNVAIDRLDNSNIERFKKDVKIDAIKAAKEKAGSLANAIGQNVGRAIHIQELDNNRNGISGVSNRLLLSATGSVHRGVSDEPEIDFEKIKLEYSVMCRFELK